MLNVQSCRITVYKVTEYKRFTLRLTSIKVQRWILSVSEQLNRSLFAQPVLNCVSKSRRPIKFESRHRQLGSVHLSPLTCSSPPVLVAALEQQIESRSTPPKTCSSPPVLLAALESRGGDAGVGSRANLAAPPPETAAWSRKGKEHAWIVAFNTRGLLLFVSPPGPETSFMCTNV